MEIIHRQEVLVFLLAQAKIRKGFLKRGFLNQVENRRREECSIKHVSILHAFCRSFFALFPTGRRLRIAVFRSDPYGPPVTSLYNRPRNGIAKTHSLRN